MATTRKPRTAGRNVTVLRGVPYRMYVELRDKALNSHLKMAYHDGRLEIVSPTTFAHEKPSRQLSMLVTALTSELEIPCQGAGSMTFRRAGGEVYKGSGKEADQSFYLANSAFLYEKDVIDLESGDPPPDLWIEVDHRASSRVRLPVYAAFGVPEVWRHRTRRNQLTFLRLNEAGTYEPIDRSLCLPMLTAGLALEALSLNLGLLESAWDRRLRAWVRTKFGPPAGAGGPPE